LHLFNKREKLNREGNQKGGEVMRCTDVRDMKDVMSFVLFMMPHCFGMVLSKMPPESRKSYLREMIKSLLETGCANIAEEDKEDLLAEMIDNIMTPVH
jgi:hypothetical protein